MKHARWLRTGALLLAAPLVAGAGAQTQPATAEPIVVVVVRHAEKAADDPRDPTLSGAGERRAEALAGLLRDAGVTHLFCTEYRRTRLTVEPLARARGLQIQQVAADDPAVQVAALRALPAGSVAVVAGHSNTVPALVRGLGGSLDRTERHETYGEMLADDAYGRMFLVVLPPGNGGAAAGVQTLELHYGGP